jgi:hypothetical protein
MRLSKKLIGALLVAVTVPAQVGRTLKAPVDISEEFVAGGFMGDGEAGTRFVQMRAVTGEAARPGRASGVSTKVTYHPGPQGWAGVYWQCPPDNWGDKPGIRIEGATKITFWAAGLKGGEIIEFKAGGIAGRRYQDSFEMSMGKVALTNRWREYSIPLARQNLASVLGAFAWIASSADNPDGVSFYLDDIRYR